MPTTGLDFFDSQTPHAQHGDQAALVSGVKNTGDGNQRTGCNVAQESVLVDVDACIVGQLLVALDGAAIVTKAAVLDQVGHNQHDQQGHDDDEAPVGQDGNARLTK